jgi:hypothetical protein
MAAPLYIRKYKLVVTTWGGQQITITDLRFTFHIEKNINKLIQYGAITIYNLSPNTETNIFKNGKSVTLEAGYEDGPYGVIFKAPIRQPIRGKENGTDYFLKLVCYAGDDILNIGFCNFSMSNNQDARKLIEQISRSSTVPFDIKISESLQLEQGSITDQKTQRGRTVFGQPGDALRSIALNNNATFYVDDDIVNFEGLNSTPPSVMPDMNYDTGMIGYPHQVDKGIELQCLINPNLRLGSWFHLDNQKIILNELPLQGFQTILDLDGVYRIVELIITGDTRGNEWYFDIVAYGQQGFLPLILSAQSQSGVS